MSTRSSPTAFALLALLRLRPEWTTYELTKELRRNARFFWPRAESRIYEQAKRLVELGLAGARSELEGRRPKTVYTITPAGRAALDEWLLTPPARAVGLEAEVLLRFLAGGQASPDVLAAGVDAAETEAYEMLSVAEVIAREYLQGSHPFQDEVHVRAFVFDLLAVHALAVLEWAERSRDELTDWPGLAPEQRRERAIRRIETLSRRLADRPRPGAPAEAHRVSPR
jgi:DNA-binding PadR family transcriptional regulator